MWKDEVKRSMRQVRSTVAPGGMSGRTAQRDNWWQAAELHFVEGYRKFPDWGDRGGTLWGSHLPVSLEDMLK